MPEFEHVRADSSVNITLEAMKQVAKEEQQELGAEQITSSKALQEGLEESVNPFARLQRTQKSIKNSRARFTKAQKAGDRPEQLSKIKNISEFAQQFQQRNPELKASVLVRFRELLKPDMTKDDLLKLLNDYYPDVTLADEVLDFLAQTTEGDMAKIVQEAKEALQERSGREITAGRNIGTHAREAAEKGLGSPTNLRDMYRNITGNPRDSSTLFQELSQQYAFKELKKVVDFLLHSLGADLKSKGPSIPRGQLHRLLSETRSLQAILGVYRFFKLRMGLLTKSFNREGLEVPSELNFETMSKEFMALTGERYPTPDKVLQTGVRLGIEKWIQAKIIALSQFRDAIREVAANQIYRSLQHRDELYLAILEALEELEDELEELLEREEQEGEEGKEEGEEQEGEGKEDEEEGKVT